MIRGADGTEPGPWKRRNVAEIERITSDFFISYSHQDHDWAEWIAWQLEDAGYSVVIQAWDFLAGSNFVVAMDDGLRQATHVVAVLSPHYLDSRFCRPEWSSAFSQDPTGYARRLIPVRVRNCKVDGLLATVVYIDLVGNDEAAARQKILDHVRQTRSKPQRQPRFPAASRPIFPDMLEIAPRDGAATSGVLTDRGGEASTPPPKLMLVLTGTIDEINKPLARAIEAHLRKISGDATLTLIRIDKGSILLTVGGTEDGLSRILQLFERGELSSLGPFEVVSVRRHTEYPESAVGTLAQQTDSAGVFDASDLISRARRGDTASMDELVSLIYPELKRRAAWLMTAERPGHDFDASGSDLVQIVLARLLAPPLKPLDALKSEADLIQALTRQMRHVLVDYARMQSVSKNRPGTRATFEEALRLRDPVNVEQVISTHEALVALSKADPVSANAAELRFFAGLTNEEAAAAMGLSLAAFRQRLSLAMAFLRTALDTTTDLNG
jgi:RNA polymerase sigma factor (TIGR02999 family)